MERAALETLANLSEHGVLLTGSDGEPLLLNTRLAELLRAPLPDPSDPEPALQALRANAVDAAGYDRRLEEILADPKSTSEDELNLPGIGSRLQRHSTPVCTRDGEPIARLWTFNARTGGDTADREAEQLRTAGALAANVVHDIRNILTPIMMELSIAKDPRAASALEQLSRFSTLTHRILAFCQPEVLELRPTAIGPVLESVAELIALQVRIYDVDLKVEIAPETPIVRADEEQLRHLLINLCVNAIQAMSERGGSLLLSARHNECSVIIEVRDTGRGMTPDIVERLFQPFFTTRSNGFGLGLYSCRRIVNEHQGVLAVASEPGKGSTFTIELPIPTGNN